MTNIYYRRNFLPKKFFTDRFFTDKVDSYNNLEIRSSKQSCISVGRKRRNEGRVEGISKITVVSLAKERIVDKLRRANLGSLALLDKTYSIQHP